jgi:ribonuclease BN (tRNA processing enzyme)
MGGVVRPKLTSIYITHGHGDHFFGIKQMLEAFPAARAVGPRGTVAADHYCGNPAGSTLRLTLGCLLAETLQIWLCRTKTARWMACWAALITLSLRLSSGGAELSSLPRVEDRRRSGVSLEPKPS